MKNRDFKNKKEIYLDIETTGLNPHYGSRITCICAKTDIDSLKVINSKEEIILNAFTKWINQYSPTKYKLITKNGKMFDIPFIITRWTKKNTFHSIEHLLNYEHFDLQEITKKRISLDDMTRLFRLESKSSTGLQAIEWWKNKEYKKIVDYCYQDVLVTEKVYKTYNSLKNS